MSTLYRVLAQVEKWERESIDRLDASDGADSHAAGSADAYSTVAHHLRSVLGARPVRISRQRFVVYGDDEPRVGF